MERNIEPIFISGDIELGTAIGVTSAKTIARYKKMGLPHYTLGGKTFYDPQEVKAWIKNYSVTSSTRPELNKMIHKS